MRKKLFKNLTYRLIKQLIETKFDLLRKNLKYNGYIWDCIEISIYNPYQKRIAWGFIEYEKPNYTFYVFFKNDTRTERRIVCMDGENIFDFLDKATLLAMKFATTKRKDFGLNE